MATSCTAYSLKGMGQECSGAVAGLKRLLIGLAREWNLTPGENHTVTISAASGATGATFYAKWFRRQRLQRIPTRSLSFSFPRYGTFSKECLAGNHTILE